MNKSVAIDVRTRRYIHEHFDKLGFLERLGKDNRRRLFAVQLRMVWYGMVWYGMACNTIHIKIDS